MKKFSRVLAVLLVALMLISSVAFAEGLSVSASYSNGKVTWNASGYSMSYRVSFGGWTSGTLLVPSGSHSITLTSPTNITISADGETASAPIKGISVPEPVQTPTPTPTPEQTTPVPEQTTPVPEQTTPVPEQSTPVPEQTTPVPEQTTPVPELTTPAPEKTTPAPEKTTPAPEKTTPAPEKTTAAPAADADDDVPKTGDTATVAYLIGAAMVLAAAYLLLRRRVHSK